METEVMKITVVGALLIIAASILVVLFLGWLLGGLESNESTTSH
jgi:hypothetical protein